MKKVLFTIALVAFSIGTYLNARTSSCNVNLTMEQVETLSTGELDNGHWLEPKTVSCKLELGGGWFTASVERVCEFSTVLSNCTAVKCGDSF